MLYRNEGRDRSTGSTLIKHSTQYRNDGRDRSTGSTFITYKTQYRNEGSDRSTGSTEPVDLSLPSFLVFYV
jgi:hypothetical protein